MMDRQPSTVYGSFDVAKLIRLKEIKDLSEISNGGGGGILK